MSPLILIWMIFSVSLPIPPLITTHEPPSIGYRAAGFGFGALWVWDLSVGLFGVIRVGSSKGWRLGLRCAACRSIEDAEPILRLAFGISILGFELLTNPKPYALGAFD